MKNLIFLSLLITLLVCHLNRQAVSSTIVDLELSTTNTISLELPTLQDIDQQYQDAGIYLDPTTRQDALEANRRDAWMGQILDTFLKDAYQSAIQNNQVFMTLQEFETDSWDALEIGLSQLEQDLTAKQPLLVDYLASGQSTSDFYSSRSDVREVFLTFEEFDYFVSMFPSVSQLTDQINAIPTSPSQAYGNFEYRKAFVFPVFVEQWTLNRISLIDTSVSQAVDASPLREGLLLEASRRFLLQDHSSDISFQESAKQTIWDGIVSDFTTTSATPPLNQVFN